MGKVAALIPAAGHGKRMDSDVNKLLLPLESKPVLVHTLSVFQACSLIDEIVVVAAPEEINIIEREIVGPFGFSKVRRVAAGGRERQDSVRLGLDSISPDMEWVVVHDGARPLLLLPQLERIIRGAFGLGSVITAVPVKDTIKRVDSQKRVTATLPRHELWAVQTPQVFPRRLLEKAHTAAQTAGWVGTDDASLLELLGESVHVVMGSYENLKITTPEDMIMAQAILSKRSKAEMKMGFGYDVHRLAAGRDLILGGVKIHFMLGLEGHSDADVLVHAVMDALLGAAALGDIGRHFPDSDEKYKGASSLKLLAHVRTLIEGRGLKVGNIDATIVAQRPKLAPYMDLMAGNMAGVLDVEIGRVNVKATTTEGLGFTGSGEGISAYAVANLFSAG